MARSTDASARDSADNSADDRIALLRSSTAALWTSIMVAGASAWLFYERYWRWRHHLAGDASVDGAGRPLYVESAIWGAVCLGSLLVAALAARTRRRLRRLERASSSS